MVYEEASRPLKRSSHGKAW